MDNPNYPYNRVLLPLVQLTDALLMTDEGINEEAYNRLVEVWKEVSPAGVCAMIKLTADATDGRFYFPSDFIGIESTLAQGSG